MNLEIHSYFLDIFINNLIKLQEILSEGNIMLKSKESNMFKIATIILSIVLLLVIGYVSYDKYSNYQQTKLQQVYNIGYNDGIADSVVQLYQNTNNCAVATINLQNITRSVADVDCINQVLQNNNLQNNIS